MDYVRSYVVPSLHFAEVVHLRDDEEDDGEDEIESTLTSSSTSLDETRKKVPTNLLISSLESNESIDTRSILTHPQISVLEELKRESDSGQEDVKPEGVFDDNMLLEENVQDTTQEIDIDAILGYPNGEADEKGSCDDAITVIVEQSMDEQGEIHERRKTQPINKRRSSNSGIFKDKHAILDKIKATLTRKKNGSTNGHNTVPNLKSPQDSYEDSPNEIDYIDNFETVPHGKEAVRTTDHIPEEKINGLNKSTSKRNILKKFVVPSDKRSSRRKLEESRLDKTSRSNSLSRQTLAQKKPNNSIENDQQRASFKKSASLGGHLSQSMLPLGKFSDRSLPRSRRGNKSLEDDDQEKVRKRPRSLSRTKFGLPNRRSSLMRSPSPEIVHPAPQEEVVDDTIDQPCELDQVESKIYKSEPNISENQKTSRPANPQRQYGRRSGRFRRAPPSNEIITIQKRSRSSEKRPISREEEVRLNGNEFRSRQRASSLPRLNNTPRQRRRSQARSSVHGSELCNLQ